MSSSDSTMVSGTAPGFAGSAKRGTAGSQCGTDPTRMDTNRGSGGQSFIPVMQAADLRKRNDLPGVSRLHRPFVGSVLGERQMSAGAVVVVEVRREASMQMPFVQDNHVIEALSPDRSDHSFNERVLPR